MPFGEALVHLLEDRQLDRNVVKRLSEKARVASGKNEELLRQRTERLADFAKRQAEKAQAKAASMAETAKATLQEGKEKVEQGATTLQRSVENSTQDIKKQADHANAVVKEKGHEVAEAVEHAVGRGKEAAAEGKEKVKETFEEGKEAVKEATKPTVYTKETLPVDFQKPRQLDASPQAPKVAPTEPYVGGPLPLGFEPPPGYAIPKAVAKTDTKQAVKAEPKPEPLPLVAPTVSDLSASEPVLGQLASTIDSLAKFLNDSPSAIGDKGAREVINVASLDLKSLGKRLDTIKEEERQRLEERLQEKTKEYSANLMTAEREMVERLEKQEDDWKSTFDSERKELVAAYREKLEGELSVQKELIEQRLKEEVVAQGIEMQRKWLSEIKERVETERGGRLSKLETLQEGFDKLGKTTLENSDWLDKNRQVNKLWTAIRAAWQASVDSQVDNTPFARELAALTNVARQSPSAAAPAESGKESASVVDTVLASIPDSLQTRGVESLPTLSSWFTDRLSPKIQKASLLPQNGGFVSYLSSAFLSNFLFTKVGFVQGEDVISTLSRAEWYLNHRDLESAAREVNQLAGWPKILARDWLEAARRHLEVRQALQVAEAEAGLASLLIQ